MIIQAFVPDWPGPKQHAKATADLLRPYCQQVTVLDNPNDFFTAQFNKAVSLFTGHVMLLVMGDVWPPENLDDFFHNLKVLLSDPSIGIYASDVKWTGQKLFRHKLREVVPNVYDVPMPEMLCWALHRSVINEMPHMEPAVNKYGWGIDYLATAAARKIGKRAVIDFSVCAKHTKGLGYDQTTATRQFEAWINTLPGDYPKRVRDLFYERQALGVRLTKKIVGGSSAARQFLFNLLSNKEDLIEFVARVPQSYDEWYELTYDVKDLIVLEEDCTVDAMRAAKDNEVDNFWFLIPQDPALWNGPNCWHWRKPGWKLNLTELYGVPAAWALPKEFKL